MKKKVLLVAGLAAILSVGLVSCGGPAPAASSTPASAVDIIFVQDITLESASLTVNIGETAKISASISPSNATTRGISYKSSDEAIAKVSSTGVVTGVAAGTANITVTSKGTKADGEPVVKTVAVTVNEVFLTGMTLAKESVKLEINGTDQIQATLTPENASVKDLEYASENPAVATVTENGLIKGLSVGNTNIVVKTKGKKADGTVIEKKVAVEVIPTAVAELRIAQPTVKFNIDDDNPNPTSKIEYEVLPSNATEKGVTFESSDTAVVTVSDTGVLTAKAVGEATITVTTVGKNAAGQSLTGTVAVTVVSQKTVIEFQNADGTLLQAYGEDDIEVGETPDYTEAIPARASDAENIYIFRGFDKDIVPYAKSESKIIYKAVYESVKSTPRHVTLTKAVANDGGSEHPVFTVTGESKGVDTETIRNKAYLAFQQYQGSWGTTYSDPQAPIINADGSWVMQWDLSGTNLGDGNTYMGKYSWNVDSAKDATDLKILHREDIKRYRHDGTTGEVLEDNKIGDDWDGVFGPNYVETGEYSEGKTSDALSPEKRQAYVDAVGAPTWVGLGVSYEPAEFAIDGKIWELFTSKDVWFLPSIRTKGLASATSATLEQDADGIYYVVNTALNMDGVTVDALSGVEHNTIDFQHNQNVDGISWDYIAKDLTATKVELGADGKTAKFKYRIDVDGIKNAPGTYTVHWGMPNRTDLKVKIDDSFEAIKQGEILYTLRRDGSTWDIPSLVIGDIHDIFELKLDEAGFSAAGGKVSLNLKGAYADFANMSGEIEINEQKAPVTFDNAGNFDFTRDVTDLMAVNTGSSYDGNKAYSVYLNMTFGETAKKYSLIPGAHYTNETKFHEISAHVGDADTNYVFVNKDGRLKVTTVNSAFTSSQLELYEKEGKAMLHVVGVMSRTYKVDGLKLAINNKNSDENFAVAVPTGGVGSDFALDFEIDVTGYENAANGVANANRLYLVNADGRTIRNQDGRGLNWTWMNDWSLGVNQYGPITVGNKVYTLSTGNNATLTVADAPANNG